MNHVLILAIAVFFASTSGIWIKLAHADPAVIAFYRSFFAFLIFLPSVMGGLRAQKMTALQHRWSLVAGVVFGLHILVWISAVQQTQVANAAICFALNPVFTAVFSYLLFKERFHRILGYSIVLGLLGVIAIGWGDLHLSSAYWMGDLLAVVSGVIFTFYLLIGRKVRAGLSGPSNRFYMGMLYGGSALITGAVAILKGASFFGFDFKTWIALGGLTLFPTILGHGVFNYLVKYLSASVISTATLAEPLFAGLMASFLYDESLTPLIILGYGFIAGSVLLLGKALKR